MPGVAARNGYPIPGADKDGVSDDEDLCPDIFGSLKNHGCPEIAQEVIKKVNFPAKNILFQTGTATLKPSLFIGLNDMAQVMKEIRGIH